MFCSIHSIVKYIAMSVKDDHVNEPICSGSIFFPENRTLFKHTVKFL